MQYICDNCLKEEVEVSTHAVHQDELDKDKRLGGDERVEGMNTESNSIQEHTIYYDIRLPAFLPESNERVRLILNLEIQLDDTHHHLASHAITLFIKKDCISKPALKQREWNFDYIITYFSINGVEDMRIFPNKKEN